MNPLSRSSTLSPSGASIALAGVIALAGCSAPANPPLEAPPSATSPAASPSIPSMPYPDNRADRDIRDVIFGQEVSDPYRWLEDVEAPAVKTWMDEQDKLARDALGELPERDAIAARLKELFYVDAVGTPKVFAGRYFFSRTHADKEKAIVYFRDGKAGTDRVLLDPNAWSEDGSTSLGSYAPSWDGKRVAYTVKENNSDEATLRVLDVDSGKDIPGETIEGAKYAHPSWTPDSKGFYYTWLPPISEAVTVAERPGFAEVRFHQLGQDAAKDVVIHEKTGDPSKFISGGVSDDGRWLVVTISHGWTENEVYFRRTNATSWTKLPTKAGQHYYPSIHKDGFFLMTDEDAPTWRIVRVDPAHPDRDNWKEIVTARPEVTLDDVDIQGNRMVIRTLVRAANQLEVRSLDGKLERTITLPGIGTVGGPLGQADSTTSHFSYQSFDTPPEIYELRVDTGVTSLFAKADVPVDPSPFTTEQVSYKSKDGTTVTMFLVHRKDLKKDGTNRVYLYGYGGFQISQQPRFTASLYPWLERGGVFAVANLRGGGEYGEAWHRDGMLLKKQNVFDDFIAAAEYLVDEGYTKPRHIAISGGSNGGLLVGAAMVQRPDLFGAVLCAVPLLDMVRYHKFGSGQTWTSEYGSAEDAEQFKALFAYSPYHHVKAGTDYPALLMLSADSDDRVDPLHARKFSAAVQDATTGGPVLLRIERNAGHGGADLRRAEVEKGADRYAFALNYTE